MTPGGASYRNRATTGKSSYISPVIFVTAMQQTLEVDLDITPGAHSSWHLPDKLLSQYQLSASELKRQAE